MKISNETHEQIPSMIHDDGQMYFSAIGSKQKRRKYSSNRFDLQLIFFSRKNKKKDFPCHHQGHRRTFIFSLFFSSSSSLSLSSRILSKEIRRLDVNEEKFFSLLSRLPRAKSLQYLDTCDSQKCFLHLITLTKEMAMIFSSMFLVHFRDKARIRWRSHDKDIRIFLQTKNIREEIGEISFSPRRH